MIHKDSKRGDSMKETSANIHEAIKLEHTYMALPEKFYSMQRPEKIPKSKLVIFNQSLAREIGLDELFFQSEAELRALADYTINRHFKEMRKTFI